MPKTGATRYQKFLKSEKSKTKLKSKIKELPKGTNVTKTNFKVKKIIIKEQLRKHGETEAVSSRKLNIKELLSRLNHFNMRSQLDALNGLTELISAHSEVLEHNLGQLIHGIAPLILNIEKAVRRETFKVLHLVLSSIIIEKMDPFFDILSTYLRSAMTHIDNRIQEDSLIFLDILLKCTPIKISQDFHKIIPNFLDMISKLRIDSKPGRTLTVNLGSDITSLKWRVKVLLRLRTFLQSYMEYINIDYSMKSICSSHTFDNKKDNYYPLFNANYTSVTALSCFTSKHVQMTIVDEVETFKVYIDTLMPLLFETWLEVSPNMNRDPNIETIVSEESACLLKQIVEIIAAIWNLVKYLNHTNPSSQIETFFSKKYKYTFGQHIVEAFPYVTNIRTKKENKNTIFEDVITDPKLIKENLKICYLFIIINPTINVVKYKLQINAVLSYIETIFSKKTDIPEDIIEILYTIFTNDTTNWSKSTSIVNVLVNEIVAAYFNNDLSNTFRQNIFALLCKIAVNDKFCHFHKCEAFEKWLTNLPDILLGESITNQTVDMIHKYAVQSHKTEMFNRLVKPKLYGIINNLPKLKISDATDEASSYNKLYSLLYWIKGWDNDSLNLLEQQLMDNMYKNYSSFILETLKIASGGI